MSLKKEREYSTQADYRNWIKETTLGRVNIVTLSLREAFKEQIRQQEVDVIVFSDVTVQQLASKIMKYPIILKPLLIATNIAARAIERDLGIKNLNTYNARMTESDVVPIAGYIKPFLPDSLPLPALVELDRIMFGDKEIRKKKGQWEKSVINNLNSCVNIIFKKYKFQHGDQAFELDAAVKNEHGDIIYAIDIKRIEARRDIHKRIDEIANKATHFKAVFPKGKFGAVIYYPFITEHGNIRDRLQSGSIDSIVFAGESVESINGAIKLLLGKFGCLKN